MGLFDKLFGSSKVEYPVLDQSSPAARHLESRRQPLMQLAAEVREPLEVVPAEDSVFIFIGKPPKKFGVAWIEEDDKIVNFRSLVDERQLSVVSLDRLSRQLKEVYSRHQGEPRFSTVIGERQVVVIPSTGLIDDVRQVVATVCG